MKLTTYEELINFPKYSLYIECFENSKHTFQKLLNYSKIKIASNKYWTSYVDLNCIIEITNNESHLSTSDLLKIYLDKSFQNKDLYYYLHGVSKRSHSDYSYITDKILIINEDDISLWLKHENS